MLTYTDIHMHTHVDTHTGTHIHTYVVFMDKLSVTNSFYTIPSSDAMHEHIKSVVS